MIKKILFIVSCLICLNISYTQNLPSERRVDWTLAGVKDSTTLNFNFLNVIDYGISNDGITVNDSILEYIIQNEVNLGAILYFPQGEYLFKKNIIIEDNIVIKGAGSDSTLFIFDMDTNHHSFRVQGEIGTDTTFIIDTALRNSDYILVQNTNDFFENDWIQIIQNDSSLVTSTWALKTVGQIVQITSVSNDTLWLKSPLRLAYSLSKKPYIIKYVPKMNIGFECFKILRIDNTAPFQSSNIYFDKAVNCWVKGIESEFCTFSHIQARFSSNIQISNSYFHEAFEYGGGGRAYGVMLHLTTNECKVENSIFRNLRHSMILQAGANANVFAYNYSIEPFRIELPNNFAGDMVLHGNYPYANLFEHNICQNLSVDNSHGPNGPFNTFFRNRAELWGIFFTASNSGNQNLIGNEVTNLNPIYTNFNYTINGFGHFEYGNNDKGDVVPNTTDVIVDSSYAYKAKPDFLNNKPWAFIGNPDSFDLGNIPSKNRILDTLEINAYCIEEKIEEEEVQDTIIESSINNIENTVVLFPNPTNGFIYFEGIEEFQSISIFDGFGNKLNVYELNKENQIIDLRNYAKGMYSVSLQYENGTMIFRKFIVQ